MELWKSRKLRIAVLCGGRSTEHEVSLCSSMNIISAIDRQRYDLTLIGVDKNGRWMLCDERKYILNPHDPVTIRLAPSWRYLAVVPGQQQAQLIEAANGQPLPSIDVAFSLLHGARGEDGSMQGLLNVLNIPYVGPDVLGSALCMDKDMTKRVLREAGIPVTPSVTLRLTEDTLPDFDATISQLGLPLFIKPASQGSSVGVSKVTDRDSFNAALVLAFHYDTKVLVEKAIKGREIETAVIGNNSPKVSVCGEIVINDEFYCYDTKYLKRAKAKLVIPAKLTASIADTIRQIARRAYITLGCSVMARIDFFLTECGEIMLNEVNTLPGFTSISMYPKLWEASGLNYAALVNRLIALTLARTANFSSN